MKPRLRSLFSPDLDESALPPDPSDCQVLIEAFIGPDEEAGEELFELVVVTPSRLQTEQGARWCRAMLLLPQFSWEEVRTRIEKLLRHCEGPDWATVAQRIDRYMSWEFGEPQG